MGSALLACLPGLPPADGTFRRWTESRGWVDAVEALAFDAPGFEGAPLFTARVHIGGKVGFAAFCGRCGVHLSMDAWPSRPLAVSDAREILRIHGREGYEAHVAHELAKREEATRG